MKFFKMLFSKVFITAVLFLIQIAIIFCTFVFFNEYVFLLRVINTVLALSIFFTIITKKESPEFKVPWLVIIFVFPVFGLFCYALFANQRLKKKQVELLKEIQFKTSIYTEQTEEEAAELNAAIPDFCGEENYLRKNAFMCGHLHNRVTYFDIGEKFWQDLLNELEAAKSFIFMEYFIIDRGAMWESIHEVLKRKAAEGVEVRVMYDDIGTLGMLKSGYYKQLRKEGINCYKFNSFKPIVSGIYNNRDHRKITVIDGRVGYTGGVNLGDEYVNENARLGHWKDTAIKIEGSAVGNLCALFLSAFDMNAKRLSNYDKYLSVEYEKFEDEGYVHPFGDGPKPFYSEQVGENNYINLINRAKRYVYITTPYLIIDHNLTAALRNAAFRGVDVRIITPHIPDKKFVLNMTRSSYPYLWQAGVKIYEYTPGFIHAKSLVADDEYAFVGTINLDYRSLVHHFECGAVMYKTPCIQDIKRDFDETCAVSERITEENFSLGKFARLTNAIITIFAPML